MKDFLRLVRYIKPYWFNATLNIIFNLLASIFSLFTLSLAIPFLGILFKTQPLVTTMVPFAMNIVALKHNFYYFLSQMVIVYGPSSGLLLLCLLVIVSTLLKNSIGYLASYNMAPVINGVVRDIQNQLYKKILQLPLSYYTQDKKGNIMARITNDVQEIKVSSMNSLDMIFRDPISIIIFITALLVMSPAFTGLALILLPLSGLLIGYIGRSLRSQARKGKEKYGELLSEVEETLSGLKVIKVFNSENRIYDRFEKNNNVYTKIVNKLTRLNSLASPISEFLGTIVIIIMMYIGGSLVLSHKNTMAPQDLIGYIVIFTQILTPLKSLSNSFYNIQRGMASVDRIDVILDADDLIHEKQSPESIKKFEQCIEFKNVSFSYGNENVLQNIDLTIEQGKMIAVVGQSGSGKSTLVDLIPRFHDTSEGAIYIDGHLVKDCKITDLRDLIGYVNQEAILFNDSFYNNIAFAKPNASMDEVMAAAKVANAHDFIMETPDGYNTTIGDRGSKLSGGQRQRLSIARAVLKNPPIMILDEATSALDTESERLVQEAIINLMQNRTSIVIAHRLSTIKHANEIIVIDKGRIAERGSHDELLAQKGIYKKLHKMQMF